MILSRLEETSPSTVHLQTWGVDLRHPICVRSDAPASAGGAHFRNALLIGFARRARGCPRRVSGGGLKPETRKGFRFGFNWNLNPPLNPPWNHTPNPFGFQTGGLNQTPNPFGFQTGGLNQTPNPVEFQAGLHQTRNPSGFQTGGLNQTPNPFGFRVSEGGVKPRPKPFGVSRGV